MERVLRVNKRFDFVFGEAIVAISAATNITVRCKRVSSIQVDRLSRAREDAGWIDSLSSRLALVEREL